MTIDLKTLITMAPFKEEKRKQLLESLPKMSDDQKFRLSSACWQSLIFLFQSRYEAKVKLMLLEIEQGKKKYTKEDFAKIEDDLYLELTKILKSSISDQEAQEIREELKKYLRSPSKTQPV